MPPERHPTPRCVALPDCAGRRPKPDSEYPSPLGETVLLVTPSGEHTLTAERVVIGRAPTCDVIIQDPLVSREHALIRISPVGVFLEDLQSANGVYVNNVRIHEPHQLCDGDRILVGTKELCASTVSSPRRPLPRTPGAETPAADVTDSVPSTERLFPAAALARAAQRMLDVGAPLEAERMLEDHLHKTLNATRSGCALPSAVCADAACRALALATALGSGHWFNYAVDIFYRAEICMSTEIAAALAEAAPMVSGVDHALLALYFTWLQGNREPQADERELVVRILESLRVDTDESSERSAALQTPRPPPEPSSIADWRAKHTDVKKSSTNHGECALIMSEAYHGHVVSPHDRQKQWSIIEAATYYDLPPILDRFGVWAICVDGVYCLANGYGISSDRLDETDWLDRMRAKEWVDETEFAAALELARTLKGLGPGIPTAITLARPRLRPRRDSSRQPDVPAPAKSDPLWWPSDPDVPGCPGRVRLAARACCRQRRYTAAEDAEVPPVHDLISEVSETTSWRSLMRSAWYWCLSSSPWPTERALAGRVDPHWRARRRARTTGPVAGRRCGRA